MEMQNSQSEMQVTLYPAWLGQEVERRYSASVFATSFYMCLSSLLWRMTTFWDGLVWFLESTCIPLKYWWISVMDITRDISVCDTVWMHHAVVCQNSLELPRAVDVGKVAPFCSLFLSVPFLGGIFNAKLKLCKDDRGCKWGKTSQGLTKTAVPSAYRLFFLLKMKRTALKCTWGWMRNQWEVTAREEA